MGLCAVILGVMAMSASSAQAGFSWLVLNSAGTVNTEVTETGGVVNLLAQVVGEKDSTHLTLLTKIVGLMISVTCTEFNLVNVNLEKNGELSLGKVKFSNCGVYNGTALEKQLTQCDVRSPGAAAGTVETENATSKLVLHELSGGGKEVLLQVVPDNAEEKFAELEFFLAECPLPPNNPVKGKVFLKDCEKLATTFAVKHLVEQGPLTTLTVGKDTAEHLETSLLGSGWAKLAGAHAGLKWSGMDV